MDENVVVGATPATSGKISIVDYGKKKICIIHRHDCIISNYIVHNRFVGFHFSKASKEEVFNTDYYPIVSQYTYVVCIRW